MEILKLNEEKNEFIQYEEVLRTDGTWTTTDNNSSIDGTHKALNYISATYSFYLREYDGAHTIYRVKK